MPKRPNPFGDPFAMQLKTHVRQKEVDCGVNKDKNMKVVYEKTLALLFEAQRNLPQTNGQAIDGQGMNGHCMNGHGVNGHEMNGHGLNGHGMNGHGMNGHGVNGHGLNGHGLNGQFVNGGHHMNGHHGATPNGSMLNGSSPQTNGQPDALQQLNGYHNGHSRHSVCTGGGDVEMETMVTDKPQLVSGQSFLDSNCRLVHTQPNGGMVGAAGNASCQNNNAVQIRPNCVMCRRKNHQAKAHCHFCEKHLCADCIRPCDNCQDSFCVLCTSVNYDERYERVFCVNCS